MSKEWIAPAFYITLMVAIIIFAMALGAHYAH